MLQKLRHPHKISLTQNSPLLFSPSLHVSSTEYLQHFIPRTFATCFVHRTLATFSPKVISILLPHCKPSIVIMHCHKHCLQDSTQNHLRRRFWLHHQALLNRLPNLSPRLSFDNVQILETYHHDTVSSVMPPIQAPMRLETIPATVLSSLPCTLYRQGLHRRHEFCLPQGSKSALNLRRFSRPYRPNFLNFHR